jgi:hypothetical protein
MPLTKIKGLGGKLGAKLTEGLGAATAGEVAAVPWRELARVLDEERARWGMRRSGGRGFMSFLAPHLDGDAEHWGALRPPHPSPGGRWVLATCQGHDDEAVTPKDKPKSLNRWGPGGRGCEGRAGCVVQNVVA